MGTSIENEIRDFLILNGADIVGFASLNDLPGDVRHNLPYGISFAVAIRPEIVEGLQKGPTKYYELEYKRLNKLCNKIAEKCAFFIESKGFRAVTKSSTLDERPWEPLDTTLPHKTVATLAGLGWIGKCALLINEKFGSAIRLNSILTDAQLTPGKAIVTSRCGGCLWCVDNCPVGAVTGNDWETGMKREDLIDIEACGQYAEAISRKRQLDSILCGPCIYSCPWTQKYVNKTLHE